MTYSIHDGEGGHVVAETMLKAIEHLLSIDPVPENGIRLLDGEGFAAYLTQEQAIALADEIRGMAMGPREINQVNGATE